MTASTNQTIPPPAHVSLDLIYPYDSAFGPEVMRFPPAALDEIRQKRAVFYSTMYGGFWVFTRYDDIRRAFQDDKLFIQDEGIPRVPFTRKFIPLSLNQP